MTRWALAVAGAAAFLIVLALYPAAALAGWRAAFLAAGSVPVGAIVLLLISRLTGADWDAALLPFAALAWVLLPAFLPAAVQQALFVARPAHLTAWLAWPLFLARGLVAIGLWWWLARLLVRGGPSPLGAGLALVAHGIVLTIVGTDWLLGTSPGQPNSAVAMILTAAEVLAATAAACLARTGAERMRRDLSFLLIAGALGLAYLLFMDFLIVWYGNLPTRVGWYVERTAAPWVELPPVALALGLALPIGCIALVRTENARALAGMGALTALALVMLWEVGPPSGWALLGAGAALVSATALARWRRA